MNDEDLLKQLNEIFIDILDNDQIVLTTETSAIDIDDWDSLNHIQIVVAIEKKFRIRMNAGEIQSWKNIGEMMESIKAKRISQKT